MCSAAPPPVPGPPAFASRAACQSRRAAMTIVEMLVVVSIIAMLMAVALPSLRAVRGAGRLSTEQSAARQLTVGYIAYTNTNREAVMPGYLPACEPSKPRFCFTVLNQDSEPVNATAARRYPWRIAPYLSYQIDGLFVGEHYEVFEQLRLQEQWDYEYAVSLAPSFGLNTEWIGGDASQMSMGFLDPGHPLAQLYDMRKFSISRITQTIHPDRLLVFASSRGPNPIAPDAPGQSMGTPAPVEGHFRVTSPRLAENQPVRWNDVFNPADPPAKSGFLSPRHRDRAVTAFIDGRVGLLSRDELWDMRHWANWANDPEWALPLQGP